MNFTREHLNTIAIHFILCTERTGSSLLSLMLTLHPQILSPSEEPFALYFHESYKNKKIWTDKDLHTFIDDFWLIAEENLGLFFTSKEKLFNALNPYKEDLPYNLLIKIIYLQFIEPKPKQDIRIIVDKQIKYFFHLKQLLNIFPDSKFIILVRDPRVNAQLKKLRHLNSGTNPTYLSALWKNTYTNIFYLKKHTKQIKIIKYEDFVSHPKPCMESLCNFLDVPFSEKMLETEGAYQTFLNIQKSKIDETYLKHLKDFHSGLFTKINTEKIYLNESEIDESINNKIIKITKPLLKEFGYEINSTKNSRLNINDCFQIIKAYLYRPLLIQFYLHIPLSIKLIIKRLKT